MEKKEITVLEYLQRIERMLLSQKNALTFGEGADFIGISKSHLYKLTMDNLIPYYKPRNKMIYFDRAELENWLLQNRITPVDELEAKSSAYVTLNKVRA